MHHLIQKSMITSLLLLTCACSSVFDSDPTESTIKESYIRDFEEGFKETSHGVEIYGMPYRYFYCLQGFSRCTDQFIKIGKQELQAVAEQFDKKECKKYKNEEEQPEAALCLISVNTPADIVKRYEDAPKEQYFRVLLINNGSNWQILKMARTDERTLPDLTNKN